MSFALLNDWKTFKKVIFHDTWKSYEIKISVPISKILLEHNHARLLTYALRLLLHHNTRAEQLNRDHTAHKAGNIYDITFFQAPNLEL